MDSKPETESSGSIESQTDLELGSKEEYYPLLDYNNCRFQHPVQPKGHNLNAQVQVHVVDQDRVDIYQVIDNIYNISNDSEENKGFVENGLNNPLSLSEVKSFYESIIVLYNIKENNPRYVEFTAKNSGNPFIMESSVPNNEENHDGQYPVLLSDTG